MSDALALLQRLATAAPALGEDGETLARAAVAVLEGEAEGLDAALGLTRPGLERPATRLRRQRRDQLLRRLAADYPARSVRQCSLAILAEIRAYETRTWPRDRHLSAPPAAYTGTTREILFALCALDFRISTSSRQIEDIIASDDAQ